VNALHSDNLNAVDLEWKLDLDVDVTKVPRFIVVEGPIGVGKTTLTKKLAATFNYEALLERPEDNPFLERFYQDRRNAALPTQLFFLFERARYVQELRQGELFEPVRVADFLIEKDRLFAQVNLDADEMKLYENIYAHVVVDCPVPDLVIYLQAPVEVLMERITQRGIESERNIEREYLRDLVDAYTEFFHYYDVAPLLIVNATDLDLVNSEQDYQQLIKYLLESRSGRHYFNPKPSIL